MTNPVTGRAEITLKSETPISRKFIVDSDDQGVISDQRKTAVVGENEDVTFEISFEIPRSWAQNYSTNGFWFTMNDTLSTGLTLTPGSEKIMVGDAAQPSPDDREWSTFTDLYDAPKVETTKHPDNKTTSLRWDFGEEGQDSDENKANLTLAGKWVKIYYRAHLNGRAEVAHSGNPNAFSVTYQHDPSNPSGGEKTPVDSALVFTLGITVKKIDGKSNKTLAGAKFQILDENEKPLTFEGGSHDIYDITPQGKTTEVTTSATGTVQFQGLKEGTYRLRETQAPADYNKLTATTKGTSMTYDVSAAGTASVEKDSSVIDVKNFKGSLPRTGSTSITMITAAGFLLLAGGLLWLVRQRRRA